MSAGEFRHMHLPYIGSSAGERYNEAPRESRYMYMPDITVEQESKFQGFKTLMVGQLRDNGSKAKLE